MHSSSASNDSIDENDSEDDDDDENDHAIVKNLEATGKLSQSESVSLSSPSEPLPLPSPPLSPSDTASMTPTKRKWYKLLGKLSALPDQQKLDSITCRWKLQMNSKRTSHHSLTFKTIKTKIGFGSLDEALGVKFTKRIRSGVPAEMREQVWWLCSGASRKLEKVGERGELTYNELIEDIRAKGVDGNGLAKIPVALDIEKDLHRTFPNNSNFLSSEGLSSLRNVLHAYSVRNPTVGYCQSMNFIAALLLLNMEEDRAFWVLAAIIEDLLPDEFYTKNMVGSRAEQRVLLSCLKWKLPRLHSHFCKIGVASEVSEGASESEQAKATMTIKGAQTGGASRGHDNIVIFILLLGNQSINQASNQSINQSINLLTFSSHNYLCAGLR